MKFALNQMTAPQLTLEGFLDLARDLGCVGVELRNDIEPLGRRLFDGLEPETAGEMVRARGLRLLGLSQVYANNLDRVETIRSDGRIDGADPSIAALTGRIEVRFADQLLVTQAINGDPCEMSFGYTLPSGESLTLVAHAV